MGLQYSIYGQTGAFSSSNPISRSSSSPFFSLAWQWKPYGYRQMDMDFVIQFPLAVSLRMVLKLNSLPGHCWDFGSSQSIYLKLFFFDLDLLTMLY